VVIPIPMRTDRGFRDCQSAEFTAGTRLLSCLPDIRNRWRSSAARADIKSAFTASVKTLYTNLMLATSDRPPKILLIGSTEPGEGKTTIAACLGLNQVAAGSRTLIVDLNLRTPALHTLFNLDRAPGLAELLAGDVALEQVIHTDAASGVEIITAGAACDDPAELLMGDNIDMLLQMLRERYDLVVLDSPAYVSWADSRILLDKSDATVFVVRWGQTRCRRVRRALTQIRGSRDQPIGIALNRVDVKSYARNGYRTAGCDTRR